MCIESISKFEYKYFITLLVIENKTYFAILESSLLSSFDLIIIKRFFHNKVYPFTQSYFLKRKLSSDRFSHPGVNSKPLYSYVWWIRYRCNTWKSARSYFFLPEHICSLSSFVFATICNWCSKNIEGKNSCLFAIILPTGNSIVVNWNHLLSNIKL